MDMNKPRAHFTMKVYEIEFDTGLCMQISGNNPISAIATWSGAIHERHSLWEIVRVTYLHESTD